MVKYSNALYNFIYKDEPVEFRTLVKLNLAKSSTSSVKLSAVSICDTVAFFFYRTRIIIRSSIISILVLEKEWCRPIPTMLLSRNSRRMSNKKESPVESSSLFYCDNDTFDWAARARSQMTTEKELGFDLSFYIIFCETSPWYSRQQHATSGQTIFRLFIQENAIRPGTQISM